MDVGSLAILILQDIGKRAVEDAGGTVGERCGVLAEGCSFSAGFDAVEFDGRVFDERVKDSGGVGAAADAGDDGVGEAAELIHRLAAGFGSDDGLEITDDHGKRMRPRNSAKDVVGGFNGAHPVAHGFVQRIFQRLQSGFNGDDFRAHKPHAEDVERLPADILGAHVDIAGETEDGGGGGGSDAVLSGTCFRDDALLAHAQSEKGLADGVVDFVSAGMSEVFALEEDFAPPASCVRRSAK